MRNYKILRCYSTNAAALDLFLADLGPQLGALDAATLHERYRARRITYSNDFTGCMARLGNQAFDCIYNFEALQKKWADERGLSYGEDTWARDVFIHQVEAVRPDVVFVHDLDYIPEDLRRNFKAHFPFVRILAAQRGFPSQFETMALADVVFTCTPKIVEEFRDHGVNARLVNHGFDATVASLVRSKPEWDEREFGLVFAGSSGSGIGPFHTRRYDFLKELFARTDIRGWVWEPPFWTQEHAPPLGGLFPERARPPVFGLDLYEIFYSSRVVFNLHTDMARGYSGNMRLFEATGAGACVLTDRGVNLGDLFEEDAEVLAYSSLEECIEKARYLADHPEDARRLAEAGRSRTLSCHTLAHRCVEIHETLLECL